MRQDNQTFYMRNLLYVFCLLLAQLGANAQENIEFTGIIVLQDSLSIPYYLNITQTEDRIEGYSISDQGGDHETKTKVVGHYRDKELSFRESEVVYTKSDITVLDMCHVFFTGKLRKLTEKQTIQGDFEGFYSDLSPCADGQIMMAGFTKARKKLDRVDRKIDKMKRFTDDQKQAINVTKVLDSVNINTLRKNQVLATQWKEPEAVLRIWDAGREDGDRVQIRIDGSIVQRNAELKNAFIEVSIDATQDVLIEIEAINTGSEGSNTAKVTLQATGREDVEILTNLQTGEVTKIKLVKEDIW